MRYGGSQIGRRGASDLSAEPFISTGDVKLTLSNFTSAIRLDLRLGRSLITRARQANVESRTPFVERPRRLDIAKPF